MASTVNNSATRHSITALLVVIAAGAALVGREVTWDTADSDTVFVWDAIPGFDDSPVWSGPNTEDSVESLAREFAHYL
jgi:hypothetical protein